MIAAQSAAKEGCKLELFTTQYAEDREVIPPEFTVLENLTRSVLDVNAKLSKRKLPLIKDILQRLYESSSAPYLIYTNLDIGLMPFFYSYIQEKVNEGHDALIINRRRLSGAYTAETDLNVLYADLGNSHPGFDCFVIKRELFEQFEFGDICIGAPFIGVSFAHNIFTFAERPLFIPDAHLTFHLGSEVLGNRNNNFYKHNKEQYLSAVKPKLNRHFDLNKFPYAELGTFKGLLKWMLNPSLSTSDYLNLKGKSFFEKCKIRLDEIRWRILQK